MGGIFDPAQHLRHPPHCRPQHHITLAITIVNLVKQVQTDTSLLHLEHTPWRPSEDQGARSWRETACAAAQGQR